VHEGKVSLLGAWPPNSPDLNLIGNVWSYVQGRVDAQGRHDFNSFRKAVLDECAAIPNDMLRNLYASMLHTRLQEVIDLNGGKIDY
jgi:hypothetical protein